MKKSRIYSLLSLLLACALIFGACGQRPRAASTAQPEATAESTAEPETTPGSDTVNPTNTPEPTASPEATAEPTPEPAAAPAFTNPLTGEATAKDYSRTRPVAVMIENNHTGGAMINQAGISQADILMEFQVEQITRNMGIFMDLENVGAIYPIRSARTYFVSAALSFDAIYVHCGQSAEGVDFSYTMLQYYTDNDNIDVGGSGNSYRMEIWPHVGEHGMVTTGELLTNYFAQVGTRTEHKTDSFDYGMRFTENAAPTDGEVANSIRIVFPANKITNLTYDESKNGYTGYQWDTVYVDDNTNDPVVFQNVLVLASPTTLGADEKWHSIITTYDYTGAGLFFNGGYAEPITWSRGGLDTPFRYYDAQGNELELGIGHSYIAFVSSGYGGATYS